MIEKNVVILENKLISKDTYEMTLDIDLTSEEGTFLELKVRNYSLRRPISIASKEKVTKIVYKVVGEGTAELSTYHKGEFINVLALLGNSFELVNNKKIILFGGGIGLPPMYQLAKDLIKNQNQVTLFAGFQTKEDVFYEQEFIDLGVETHVSTDDGSYGFKGNLIENSLKNNPEYDLVYGCGPRNFLKALENHYKKGYVSFESRMACGFGICNACLIKTVNGAKKVCKDGPVFEIGEIIYE